MTEERPPATYCHLADTNYSIRISSTNKRWLVHIADGVDTDENSVQCIGALPQSCGDLDRALSCSDRSCPCVVNVDYKLMWPYMQGLAQQVSQHYSQQREDFLKPDSTHAKLKVLNIGVGAGMLPMSIASTWPEAQIESIDVDWGMVWLAKHFFGFIEGPSNQVFIEDASEALPKRVQARRHYDVILIDCFNSSGVPPPCRSGSFVRGLAALTQGGGRVAQHVWNGDEDILETYRQHFPHVEMQPGSRWGGEPIIVAWMDFEPALPHGVFDDYALPAIVVFAAALFLKFAFPSCLKGFMDVVKMNRVEQLTQAKLV